jgi:hypothetical protein
MFFKLNFLISSLFRLDTGKDGRITAEEFAAGKASIEKVT